MHRIIRHIARYYASSPQNALSHGSSMISAASRIRVPTVLKHGARLGGRAALHTAKFGGRAAVHIGKLTWTHGPRLAKHTTKFMVKAALKTFRLFKS
jgi:hypothetical protein